MVSPHASEVLFGAEALSAEAVVLLFAALELHSAAGFGMFVIVVNIHC
jgi:hypothetical protein